ncbi:MAG: cytochrome c family protein [Candidatus Marinimicrobia bacterium]|nr:cytochrome c family protein [Candidatus Neomarinimicrobiota bacterium]MCF7850848.1 cytochrome c family protein [Candidatus Neomarinimicrobiota bacterium]
MRQTLNAFLIWSLLVGISFAQDVVADIDYPELIKIDELSNIFHPVDFAHGLHARMTVMGDGCATCHHHAEDDIYEPCSECHLAEDPDASMAMPTLNGAYHRNCLNCHQDWVDDDVCQTCHIKRRFTFSARKPLDETDILAYEHQEIQVPEIVNFVPPESDEKPVVFHHREHTELYRYDCATCHRKTNCSKCHQFVPHGKGVVSSLAHHHDPCSSCHETEKEDQCAVCHTDSPSKGFVHAVTGFPLKSFHTALECSQCHGKLSPIKALDPDCLQCHDNFEVGMFDHSVTGLTLNEYHEEIDCYECHMDDKYDVAPACWECHDEDISFPDQIPGTRTDNN